jgi:molybdopterin-guanine dinucleotide biosynthesis protein A
MGSDKALFLVEGRPMAVRVADALWEAGCHPVWCQGGDLEALTALGLDAVADETPGEGPVGAILSALRHGGGELVVAACDLVALDAATVRLVIDPRRRREPVDVAVARADGRDHLLSWWSAGAMPKLERLFDDGVRSYRTALSSLRVVEIEVPSTALQNANRPDDVARG